MDYIADNTDYPDRIHSYVSQIVMSLSASTVLRLKRSLAQEYRDWCQSRLDKDRWMYMWADGVYSDLRAEQTKLCALVVIGVNERGDKQFLAIEDGVWKSTQSWREVLLKLKDRGMNMPDLAIGYGAMGFWTELEEPYPDTRQQLLDAQDHERTELSAEIDSTEGETGAAGALAGRYPGRG